VQLTNLPKITEHQKIRCDYPISEKECKIALNQLNTNKSLRLDRFSADLYRIFWDEIKQCFLDCILFTSETGRLSETQYQGVITLIPKPGKDPTIACSYRPIILLNCDCKIISKVINNRLTDLLHNLIGPEQNGFIKGRYIGYNVRMMFDFMDYMDYQDDSRTLLSLDMCKAFDSLIWDFIFEAFKSFGFGNYFIN